MTVRQRRLEAGWYPATARGVEAAVERYLAGAAPVGGAVAGVAPHAGWGYSGAIAALVVRALSVSGGTVVVVGGHLGAREPLLAAPEEAYETPQGPLTADLELLASLRRSLELRDDLRPDNTVEVQLPLIRHLHPEARVLALRAPPSMAAVVLGAELARLSEATGRRIVVLGSTDLTHYGEVYGFAPRGTGPAACRWVREVNDARLVRALLAMDPEESLRAAREDHSACSVGAALCALSYARGRGVAEGTLLRYGTSLDAQPAGGDEQLVGYAGVAYVPGEDRARVTASRENDRADSRSSGVAG